MEFTNPIGRRDSRDPRAPATVAVVGCSDNPARDSLRIAMLLKRKGFRVIPVNPQLAPDALMSALGERCYPGPRLDSRAGPDGRRLSPLRVSAEIAEAAIAKGARVLWCQFGVVNLDAARARERPG